MPKPRPNSALLLLLTGDFSQGWQEYEWCWQTRQLKQTDTGRNRSGRAIRFRKASSCFTPNKVWAIPSSSSALPRRQAACRHRTLRMSARVGSTAAKLCRGHRYDRSAGEPLPAHDVHAPLLSLPRILMTTLETIPASIPYLHADAARIADCGLRIADSKAGPESFNPQSAIRNPQFTIGIVWQGHPRTSDPDRQRGIGDGPFAWSSSNRSPVCRALGSSACRKDSASSNSRSWRVAFPSPNWAAPAADFSDTAAVMKNLDLVISADTSSAHLAGALGVPVWVPLPAVPCWRWLMNREAARGSHDEIVPAGPRPAMVRRLRTHGPRLAASRRGA